MKRKTGGRSACYSTIAATCYGVLEARNGSYFVERQSTKVTVINPFERGEAGETCRI